MGFAMPDNVFSDKMQAMITDVNDAIMATAAAKRELKLRSEELVATMKAEGKNIGEGARYIREVTEGMTPEVRGWAMHYFYRAWATEE